MTPFTSILAATDFSIDGNNAVRRAALLAHEHGGAQAPRQAQEVRGGLGRGGVLKVGQ